MYEVEPRLYDSNLHGYSLTFRVEREEEVRMQKQQHKNRTINRSFFRILWLTKPF